MLFYNKYFDIGLDKNNPSADYLIPLYSVPLLHIKVENWEVKKQPFFDLYNQRKSNNKVFKSMGASSFEVETDYHQTMIEENFDEDLRACIANNLCEELGIVTNVYDMDVCLENCWFEKSVKGRAHPVHNHGHAGLSAVLFMKFDPKFHTPTVFLNPITASDGRCGPQNEMPPGIREGSLIVFPSFVNHYTSPCETDEERIIMSFNMQLHHPQDAEVCDEPRFEKEYYLSSNEV
jgi:hypothetical protein